MTNQKIIISLKKYKYLYIFSSTKIFWNQEFIKLGEVKRFELYIFLKKLDAVCICLMFVMVASQNNKLILGGKLYHTVKVSFELFKVSLRTYQSKKDAWGNSKIKWGKRWGNGYVGEILKIMQRIYPVIFFVCRTIRATIFCMVRSFRPSKNTNKQTYIMHTSLNFLSDKEI